MTQITMSAMEETTFNASTHVTNNESKPRVNRRPKKQNKTVNNKNENNNKHDAPENKGHYNDENPVGARLDNNRNRNVSKGHSQGPNHHQIHGRERARKYRNSNKEDNHDKSSTNAMNTTSTSNVSTKTSKTTHNGNDNDNDKINNKSNYKSNDTESNAQSDFQHSHDESSYNHTSHGTKHKFNHKRTNNNRRRDNSKHDCDDKNDVENFEQRNESLSRQLHHNEKGDFIQHVEYHDKTKDNQNETTSTSVSKQGSKKNTNKNSKKRSDHFKGRGKHERYNNNNNINNNNKDNTPTDSHSINEHYNNAVHATATLPVILEDGLSNLKLSNEESNTIHHGANSNPISPSFQPNVDTTTATATSTLNSNATSNDNNNNSFIRTDSVASFLSEKSLTEKDAVAGNAGVIDFLKQHKSSTSTTATTITTTTNPTPHETAITASTTSSTNTKSSNPKKSKTKKSSKKDKTTDTNTTSNKSTTKKKKKQDETTNTEVIERRAARRFNTSVQQSVQRSDPDSLYELLHNKHNHKYALDSDVLEMVLKAYVVAAMFEEALYCLRHVTSPATLSTIQTEKILQCLPQNLRNSSAYVAADMINALCIATAFDKPTHRTYFLRIVRGIALEFLEDVTNARDRICSVPCERLIRSAVCVVDARFKRGNDASKLVVIPGNQLGIFVPDVMENRGIQTGDAVGILPYAGPFPISAESLDRNMIEATVIGVQPLVLRLQDKTNALLYATLTENSEGNVYRIDKLANRIGFNRQLSAAVALASPVDKDMYTDINVRRPSPELIKAITAMDENIDRLLVGGDFTTTQNRSRYQGEASSTAALCAQPVPFNSSDDYHHDYDQDHHHYRNRNDDDSIRDTARLALQKFGSLEGLNESQTLAVESAVTNRLTLIQGPPGTGKTAVAIRVIQHWARLAQSETGYGRLKQILATSDSNIAVDNLVEGCANVGLRVVRLGRPESTRPELLKYCIERSQPNNSNSNQGYYGFGPSYAERKEEMMEKLHILRNAQVICCTCIGSGADILGDMTFERVLVDEATQATEPAVLVPLTRNCRQLVLVGDHCQLPPTVLSTLAEEEGLGVPLFSRMVACGVPPVMLDTQYRMHPGISMFPSDLFYGGKLLNGVSAPERRPLAGFPWPREEFPVAFVSVSHGVEVDDGGSKYNEAEAAAACDAVAALLQGGQCTASDIAVVTPYSAQVRLIRRMTRKLVSQPPFVEVSSTDGFQGREKEAVVFSAVRSNDWGNIGFCNDWRRVNVSFTRARRGLIVIGNDVTLRRGDPDTWMPWLAWADAHGVNMDKPGIPRGRYDPETLRRVRGGTTAAQMLKDVLERQQAQLKTAEKQLEKAEKKASGLTLTGNEGNQYPVMGGQQGFGCIDNSKLSDNADNLKQDLALLSNTDGCWDDSDDEENENVMHHSTSLATFETMTSNETKEGNEPLDAWDL